MLFLLIQNGLQNYKLRHICLIYYTRNNTYNYFIFIEMIFESRLTSDFFIYNLYIRY